MWIHIDRNDLKTNSTLESTALKWTHRIAQPSKMISMFYCKCYMIVIFCCKMHHYNPSTDYTVNVNYNVVYLWEQPSKFTRDWKEEREGQSVVFYAVGYNDRLKMIFLITSNFKHTIRMEEKKNYCSFSMEACLLSLSPKQFRSCAKLKFWQLEVFKWKQEMENEQKKNGREKNWHKHVVTQGSDFAKQCHSSCCWNLESFLIVCFHYFTREKSIRVQKAFLFLHQRWANFLPFLLKIWMEKTQ